ncbi:MAG: hypothetical protein AAFX03_06850 [Pseudomonadota bacterium]
MTNSLVFWIVAGLAAFALALAIQMRIMTALVLRRALIAWDGALDRAKANTAVVWAAGAADLPAEAKPWLVRAVDHLRTAYPKPLAHIRMARRASLVLPAVLIGLAAAWRAGGGG